MKAETIAALEAIIKDYDTVIKVVADEGRSLEAEGERAFGGYIRAIKGRLQEHITKRLVEIAWNIQLGQADSRLDINSIKIPIPINPLYFSSLPPYLASFIAERVDEYVYGLSVDRQIFIDGKFVCGIECKAFTENAMLKRIMVDFMLLKTRFPNLKCRLFQLESMLGGDYSFLPEIGYGSTASHTIMSYFPHIELQILTFIQGERDVRRPLHDKRYYKPLNLKALERAIALLTADLAPYCHIF